MVRDRILGSNDVRVDDKKRNSVSVLVEVMGKKRTLAIARVEFDTQWPGVGAATTSMVADVVGGF